VQRRFWIIALIPGAIDEKIIRQVFNKGVKNNAIIAN